MLATKLAGLKAKINQAHELLMDTSEWQTWNITRTVEDFENVKQTIEYRNYSLLIRAYKSMYGDKE
jgi:hypothetical protein